MRETLVSRLSKRHCHCTVLPPKQGCKNFIVRTAEARCESQLALDLNVRWGDITASLPLFSPMSIQIQVEVKILLLDRHFSEDIHCKVHHCQFMKGLRTCSARKILVFSYSGSVLS